MVEINKFNNYKPARISKDLYEIEKCRWRLSVPATRLLFALSQVVSESKTAELFPDLGFSTDTIFKYLGISKWNNRYEVLKNALKELMENPLDIVQPTKKGGTQWLGLSWLTKYFISTDEPLVKIKINEDVKPYLQQLTQYSRIQPKVYLKLSSEYQNWFYPYFKQFENLGKWTVEIVDLKKLLKLEKLESYNEKKNVNACQRFLNAVLGIELSPEAKNENTNAKKEKRQAKPIEWNYTKNAKGEYTGTLFHISDKTDLNVTASCLKTGRSYTHIVFFIASKRIKTVKKSTIDSNAGVDFDFQKTKRRKAKTQKDIQDMFASEFDERLYIPNPAYEKELPKRVAFYTDEQIKQMANETKKTLEQTVKLLRLQKDNEGRWYKEY